jgi:cytochrome c1
VIARFALLMLPLAGGVEAQDRALVARGQDVFKAQGCYGDGWLHDPSRLKPGAHMPKLQLADAEVKALAAYLGSLR